MMKEFGWTVDDYYECPYEEYQLLVTVMNAIASHEKAESDKHKRTAKTAAKSHGR